MHIFVFVGNYIFRIIFGGWFYERRKHLKVTGSSKVSWKDAIVKTVAEAAETLDYISEITILEQKAKIDDDKISEYFVSLDLAFLIDRNRDN